MSEATYTKITILGDEYRVAGEATGASIPDLAAYVADKMSEVKQSGSTIDPKRIAVLTALNLADELLRERAETAQAADRVRQRTEALTAVLDATLAEDGRAGLLE